MYNETYDEYIRSILGYPSMQTYEEGYQDYRNQNMNMNYNATPNMYNNSMNSNPDMDLESCYPEIYKIVYPMITKKCNNVGTNVTREDIENMTDEIYYALEERNDTKVNINLTNEVRGTENSSSNTARTIDKKPDVKISEASGKKRETRQFNRGLRDLIQILLIRELLRRRREGRPPIFRPRPPMRPPMRPPFRPGFGPGASMFNRDFEMSNYDIFEN